LQIASAGVGEGNFELQIGFTGVKVPDLQNRDKTKNVLTRHPI
jgi:hypothetical protein